MEEMMENQPDAICNDVLKSFVKVHQLAAKELWDVDAIGCKANVVASANLEKRRAELLGKMERFRDQGDTTFSIANLLHVAEAPEKASKDCQRGRLSAKAATYYEQTRKIAEAHGFFSLECKACLGKP